jgi:hypothetical protein
MKNRGLVILVIGGFALAALPLIFWLWVRLGTRAYLAPRQLAELRKQGHPVTLAEIAGPPVAESDNAAAGLAALAPQLKRLEPATTAFLVDSDQPGWPSPAQLAAATTALAGQDTLFTQLDQATRRPAYRPAADYTKAPDAVLKEAFARQGQLRLVFRALRMRAATQLAAGQGAEARQSCLMLLRLARHAEQEPLLNGHLMTRAIRFSAFETLAEALSGGGPSEVERGEIAKELSQHDPAGAYRHALVTERAFGIASFEGLKGLLTSWYWNDDLSRYLTLFEPAVSANHKPALPPAATGTSYLGAMSRGAESSVSLASQAANRDLAAVRAARILVALAGQPPRATPPSAAELELPADIFADPFRQGALIVKPSFAGRWLIYSVDANGQDDGGDRKRDLVLELAPAPPTAPVPP